MRILPKSLLVIGISSLLAFVVFGVFGWFFILDSYRAIERSNAEDAFRRTLVQLESLKENHARVTSDYGIWPDAHQFVITGAPGFVERNLNEDPFKNLRINFLAYYHNDGSVAWQRAYDLDKSAYMDWPVEIDQELRAAPQLVHGPKTTAGHTG